MVEKVLGTGGFGITYKVSSTVMVDYVAKEYPEIQDQSMNQEDMIMMMKEKDQVGH